MSIKSIYVFYLYFYILVFSIINRSFAPLGMDLRYVIFPLGVSAILVHIFNNGKNVRYPIRTVNLAVLALYIFVLQSFWNINVQIVEYEIYQNVIILNLYNIFNIIVISLYYREVNLLLFYRAIKISLTFLGGSIVISFIGVELPYNSYQSLSMTSEMTDFARYCGYGTDPNYVSMFFVSFAFIAYEFIQRKKEKFIIAVICIFFLLLSRSATVITLTVLCFVVRYIYILLGDNPKLFVSSLLFLLFGVVFLLLETRMFDESVSLAIRYGLWERAYEHFVDNPWLGNGITSVRNFSFLSESRWFVQAHSTFFQILCEHGLIALIIYFYIFYRILYDYLGTKIFYAVFIYFIWSFTYETMYLGFPIIYFAILPCCVRSGNEDKYEKRNGSFCN